MTLILTGLSFSRITKMVVWRKAIRV